MRLVDYLDKGASPGSGVLLLPLADLSSLQRCWSDAPAASPLPRDHFRPRGGVAPDRLSSARTASALTAVTNLEEPVG